MAFPTITTTSNGDAQSALLSAGAANGLSASSLSVEGQLQLILANALRSLPGQVTVPAEQIAGGALGTGAYTFPSSVVITTTANAGTSYSVAGTKVVGAQGAAVADLNLGTLTLLTEAITAIGTIQTQVNLALARLRAHGLIAT